MQPWFVAGECHFSWREFERETIAEVDLMFLRQGCTEAKNRKQELTGKEVAKKIAKKSGPVLFRLLPQRWPALFRDLLRYFFAC